MTRPFIPLAFLALASACAAAAPPAHNAVPPALSDLPPPPPAYSVTKTLPVEGPEPWTPWSAGQVALDPQTHLLYIPRYNRLQAIDITSGKVVAEIPGNGVWNVALLPALGRGYFSNAQAGTVTIFDLKTQKILGNINVDKSPRALIYDPFSKRIFVSCGDSHTIRPFPADIDPNTGKTEDAIQLDGSASALLADGFGMVYATVSDQDEVAVIDSRRMTLATSWLIPRWSEARSIAMDPKHSRLYIGCRASVLIIAAADGQQLGDVHIPPPNASVGIGALAFRDGYAYASNGAGTISLIGQNSAGKFQCQATFPVPPKAWGFAMDPKSGAIYLPAADESESHNRKTPGIKLIIAEAK